MSTLKLIWIKCVGLGEGESIELTPFFLNVPVGSPSGPATVTVTGSSMTYFPTNTTVDFAGLGSLIYLKTPDASVFSSNDYIWDTKPVCKETIFNNLVDTTGASTDLQPIVYYKMQVGVFALLLYTVQGIALKIGLLLTGLFTLLILNPVRFLLGRNEKERKERNKDNGRSQ